MKQARKLSAAITALTLAASAANTFGTALVSDAAYGVGGNGKAIMEYLDRGIYAVKNGGGMFVSWRYNANDSDDAEFRLYRDDKLIYTSKSGDATCYQDNGGSASSKYRVDCVEGGKVVNSQSCKFTSGSSYFDIKLDRPGSQYSPNDCAVGDVNGDGQYEIFLKWDPSNAKDNSQEGKTDKVCIDCYTLEGKRLWRIDMGQNIRAGQHYTQLCVADFDCDGKAELITKTADGTKDGTGKTIGDGSKSYANGKGYILDGPEYLSLFDGQTGRCLDTIDYPVPRGKVSDWGDNYGNRVDRMNSGIAYLDGIHPSAIYGRGYYTRLTWSAVDVRDGKLVKRWVYDSGNKGGAFGNGNHNVMAADVDNDGKQEVLTGASCIDDDGKLLWCSGDKHGDAMHVGDLIPDREGLEVWECHEDKPYGESCYDAATGKKLFHINGTKDTGRCAADNVWAGNKGAEFWGAADNNVYDKSGKKIAGSKPAQNFFIYWDGDLEREILDGTKITKMTGAGTYKNIFTAADCSANNGSKNVPCLSADLFGDWREELILRTSDNSKLRIWCTTDTTKVRLTTLMHDIQYRAQAACEQSCYNQPPHVSCYLSSDAALPARPNVKLNNTPDTTVIDIPSTTEPAVTTVPTTAEVVTTTAPVVTPQPAAELQDGQIYVFRNAGTGLYLGAENTNAANNTNVILSGSSGAQAQFRAVSAGDGYYFFVSQLGDGASYALDINGKKTADGTNIELYELNKGDNQQFKAVKNDDGSYKLAAKIANDSSCISAEREGGNVQEWTLNGSAAQNWFIETAQSAAATTTTTTAPTTTTTTVTTATTETAPETTTAATETTAAAGTYGDVNLDGRVTVADAVAILQYIGNRDRYPIGEQGKKNGDVDGVSGLTANDALVIQQVDAGIYKQSELPIK